MNAPLFISKGIRFKSRVAAVSIAVSFAVMIVAIAIASGFRSAIYDALSEMCGDISVEAVYLSENAPVMHADRLCAAIEDIDGVQKAVPVIYAGGILKNGDNVHGVLFKGMDRSSEGDGTTPADSRSIVIPRRLAAILSLDDSLCTAARLTGYFIGDRVSVRNFEVAGIYDGIVTDDDKLTVMCDAGLLRRVVSYGDGQAGGLEITLDPAFRDAKGSEAVCEEISYLLYEECDDGQGALYASTLRSRYSQIFGWLDLIDMNVNVILILMTIVAGFNMVSGLLILLFQNINTIGVLKTLGMSDRGIIRTFLLSSARSVCKAMLCGNAVALLLCAVQYCFHAVKLDPENYFISYVPVSLDFGFILATDILAFLFIMAVITVPCAFIAGIRPSRSVDYR